ncbi:hypothetical protein AhnVgp107 [Adoxophyes honmai nucleopolyhedrovirus]|uniref:Uncharacterized protein n=1 Tax=Adoxophyes honmai nucleopolyhedrovirus TaxID=224399 RepID=Q80LI9_NPVAH|nr:hypothetical protein AhnVgp107 [Adoxophyes honmai nucleopolyhedrovirus]BAC67358.1 hypothetical protein [Adoxophyes honmai nucleopolyhedrovirus]
MDVPTENAIIIDFKSKYVCCQEKYVKYEADRFCYECSKDLILTFEESEEVRYIHRLLPRHFVDKLIDLQCDQCGDNLRHLKDLHECNDCYVNVVMQYDKHNMITLIC